MPRVIKLAVLLSSDVVDAIREIATRRQITMTEVISNSIGTEKFIEEEKSRSKFLLEDNAGNLRRVFFR